jgi:hypothetical protein
MPTVQRYQRQVRPAAMPGVRRTAALTPEAAGVQVARAKGDLEAAGFEGSSQVAAGRADLVGRVATTSLALYERLRQNAEREADTTAFLEATNRTAVASDSYLTDPKTGAFQTKKGKNSSELLTTALAEYDRMAAEASAELKPNQRATYDRWRDRDRLQFSQRVSGFVTREQAQYQDEVAQSTVNLAINKAVANVGSPTLFYSALSDAVTVIKTRGADTGRSQEAIDETVLKTTSVAHDQAINSLLEKGLVGPATKWLNTAEAAGQIEQGRVTVLRDKIKGTSLDKQGQELADRAMAEATTLTEQEALVRKWTEGDQDPTGAIRKYAEGVLGHREQVTRQETLEYERATLRSGYDIINKTGTWTKIPTTVLNDPKNAELVGHWKTYARQQRDIAQPDRYGPEYLSQLRYSVKDPAAFKDVNLEKIRHLMTREEYGHLNELQVNIIAGNAEAAAKKLPGIAQFDDTVTMELLRYGYKKEDVDGSDRANATRKSEVLQIKQSVARQIDARSAASQDPITKEWKAGQRVTDQDVRDMIAKAKVDQVLAGQRTGWWPWSTSEALVQKPAIEMTIGDVPRRARQEIEAELRRMTNTPGPFPDAMILSRYLNEYPGARR